MEISWKLTDKLHWLVEQVKVWDEHKNDSAQAADAFGSAVENLVEFCETFGDQLTVLKIGSEPVKECKSKDS